ncbi:MAG: SlyX family protein [Planctomycetota bacterium]|nr:SlyX family protein [Planctomycetaceae bacterium]MDQ3330227.1 SlyX family protein [Planctomycetota bacterium]
MTDDPRSQERLTAIETLLMHMQHEFEQLNAAILGQQRDLDALRKDMDAIRGHVERLEAGPETRDPKLEKPPHY